MITRSASKRFNKNQHSDLVIADMDASMVRIFPDFITGQLVETKTFPIPAGPNSVVATDIDGDGDLDLASADGASSVYLFVNKGGGRFDDPIILDAAPIPWWIISEDVELDGDADLIMVNEPDMVSLLRNNGDGAFAEAEQIDAGPNGGNGSVQTGDINGDDYPDLVTRHWPDPILSVLFNDGDGGFSAPTDYPLASEPHGMNDVIAVGGGGEEPGQLQLFLNRGQGVLDDPMNHVVGGFPLTPIRWIWTTMAC